LIGRRTIGDGDAMLFENCSCIHTFFMRVPIDVVFLDERNVVVRVVKSARPWRPLIGCSGARNVVELAAGSAERYGITEGETLDLVLR
jgi:uncharacterized protein